MKTIHQYLFLGAFLGMAGTAMAQDSYDAQTFVNSDLNGTSRFVSMGGALGALGGDISVMSTNPAGTAMYRKSDAAITLSGVFTNDNAMGHDKARMSFDQGGALIAFDMDNPSGEGLQFVNFGVNYQKKRNFFGNHNIGVQHMTIPATNGDYYLLSQSFQIADMGNWAMEDAKAASLSNDYDLYFGSLLYLATAKDGTILVDMLDDDGNQVVDQYGNVKYAGVGAEKAYMEKATYGANIQADLNLSFNVSDQFFFGASLGVYHINYDRESSYQEFWQQDDGNGNLKTYSYEFNNWYKTTGDGFDVKLGFICRPIEDSPFRFGVSVHTPIWYRMTDSNGGAVYYKNERLAYVDNREYDYHFRTPWKFGFSLGHTIGTNFAIGAEYEFQDLSTAKYSDVDHYEAEYFRNVNRITKQTLRGQHTLKVGVEYKPIEEFSIRAGYNFLSSPFKQDAFRTIGYDSPYTETDYTNWGPINRFTVGLGYRYKGGYFDIAWQYQAQKGDFYAFDNSYLKPTKINNNRSQLMATLGFRF